MTVLIHHDPKTRAQRAPSPSVGRVALVFTILTASAAGLTLGGRALAAHSSLLAVAASALAGAAAMLLLGTFIEWVVHRWIMHRPFRSRLLNLPYELHHKAHHWTHFPPDRYLREGVHYTPLVPPQPKRQTVGGWERTAAALGQTAFYSAFALPLPLVAWLLTANLAFAVGVALVAVLVVGLCVHVHDAVHCPGHSPFERFRWFRSLDRHHYIHHIDPRANTNFLVPLADWMLGTLRTELTDRELNRWPTWEQARAVVHPPVCQGGAPQIRSFPASVPTSNQPPSGERLRVSAG